MNRLPNFVIYAPQYRRNSGGAIVMNKLCDMLNQEGHSAKLWPLWKPLPSVTAFIHRKTPLYYAWRLYTRGYPTNPAYNTPLASPADIDRSIVVYPEIVNDNPLRAKRYVRWLLHSPGFHKGSFKYAAGDMYFYFQEAFNNRCNDMVCGGPLTVEDMPLDIFRQINFGERTNVCFMIRKGRHRKDIPSLRGKWVVDGLSHESLADAFNECRICYFYDAYTAYAPLAAACGCIPVIVPLPNVTREMWSPHPHLGVAYGDDDIPRALATREALLDGMRSTEARNVQSVRNFVSAVCEHFCVKQASDTVHPE